MRRRLTRAALLGSVFLMSGCAGIPTAVSVASIYVNSILFLRTNKGVADHAVSAAMDRDCGFANILDKGEYCTDAPAPKVLVAMMADADALTLPSGDPVPTTPALAVAEAPMGESGPASGGETRTIAVASKPTRTQVAAQVAMAPVVADTDAGAQLIRHVRTANRGGHRVVLGSYRSRAAAAEHLAALHRDDAEVVAAASRGATVYRVVIETGSRDEALREMHLARAGGTPDAWITGPEAIPEPTAPAPAPGTRIATPDVKPATPYAPQPVEPVIPLLADVELTPIL